MSNWKSPVDELNQHQKNILPERICPECGKKIVRVSFNDYVYRRGNKIYCSWTCYRKEYHRKNHSTQFKVI